MASDRATQQQVLQAIVDRLRAKIPECTEVTCFLCDQITPIQWPGGPFCCTVTVGDGRYPEPFAVGGGVSTLAKQMTLDVTAWLRCNLDSQPSMEAVLHQDLGLWSTWEPAILAALLLETDDTGRAVGWMPVGPDGLGLLRNYPAPVRTSGARPDVTGEWLGMTITFAIDFDWRL